MDDSVVTAGLSLKNADSVQLRQYQLAAAKTALEKGNTLVVMPTALGKTFVAVLVIARMLFIERDAARKAADKGAKEIAANAANAATRPGKYLFLAPTKPLAIQQEQRLLETLDIADEESCVLTGEIPPAKREALWKERKFFSSTPQTVEHDILTGKIDLKEFKLIVFDEVHHAVKNYAYSFIARQATAQNPSCLLLGLTASPSADREKVAEICSNLNIKNIEVITGEEKNVEAYSKDLDVEKIFVDMYPEQKEISQVLREMLSDVLKELKKMGLAKSAAVSIDKHELLEMRALLLSELAKGNTNAYRGLSLQAKAMNILHAIDLLEAEGINSLKRFLDSLTGREKKTKAIRELMADPRFTTARSTADLALLKGLNHPKMEKLRAILEETASKGQSAIVFAHYRHSVESILEEIRANPRIKAAAFVGKSNEGMSQKKQHETLEKFRAGSYNVLVSTSLHGDEFIIVRDDANSRIQITKIGEFVERFLEAGKKSASLSSWSALSTDGKNVSFKRMTAVYRHLRKNNVVRVRTENGFETIITENHSLFSFNSKGGLVPAKPSLNKFVALASHAPPAETITEVDLLREMRNSLPASEYKNIYCSLSGITQAKVREMKSELAVLKNASAGCYEDIAATAGLDRTTITDVVKRLEKNGFVTANSEKRKHYFEVSLSGKEHLEFLAWYFENMHYYKKKYRVPAEAVIKQEFDAKRNDCLWIESAYCKFKLRRMLKITPALCRYFGFYVSEGFSGRDKTHSRVFLAAQRPTMRNRMIESIRRGLELPCRESPKGVALNSHLGFLLTRRVFNCGAGAHEKEVPSIVFNASKECKWAFLEAYTAGDGYVSKKGKIIVLTTVSRKLAAGLIFLLRQLGVKKVTVRKDHTYRINIHEPLPFAQIKDSRGKKSYYNTIPTALSSQKAFAVLGNDYAVLKTSLRARTKTDVVGPICFDYVKSISKVENQPKYVYDLGVEETERFFGGVGLLALHNSIGEEGLDIPRVDLVVFYESVPSEIRLIQRRGRAGRVRAGNVLMLVTKGTKDEAFLWIARRKERQMHENMRSLKKSLARGDKDAAYAGTSFDKRQKKIDEFF